MNPLQTATLSAIIEHLEAAFDSSKVIESLVHFKSECEAHGVYSVKKTLLQLKKDLAQAKKELKKTQCQHCKKPGIALHTCPFACEIRDDYKTLCNCCVDCQRSCAMDI